LTEDNSMVLIRYRIGLSMMNFLSILLSPLVPLLIEYEVCFFKELSL
jgi:hypothetical protein